MIDGIAKDVTITRDKDRYIFHYKGKQLKIQVDGSFIDETIMPQSMMAKEIMNIVIAEIQAEVDLMKENK